VTSETLETEVRKLWNLHEIQLLKARYFRFMDLKQWDEFRDVFTDDFELFIEDASVPQSDQPTLVGADALVKYLSAFDPPRITLHQGHMPEIELIDDNNATGIWAMYDWVDDPRTGQAHHGYGHYHERYVRNDDGKWRISSTRLTRIRVNFLPSQPSERNPSLDPTIRRTVLPD
jgi:hypothetical protein